MIQTGDWSQPLETSDGTVVVTGYAYRGTVHVSAHARQLVEVSLVMGGFHLNDASATDINTVIEQLKWLSAADNHA